MAVKYFREYLKRYPYSGQAVVARRFLEELGGRRGGKMKKLDDVQSAGRFQKVGLILAVAFYILSVIMVIRNHGRHVGRFFAGYEGDHHRALAA